MGFFVFRVSIFYFFLSYPCDHSLVPAPDNPLSIPYNSRIFRIINVYTNKCIKYKLNEFLYQNRKYTVYCIMYMHTYIGDANLHYIISIIFIIYCPFLARKTGFEPILSDLQSLVFTIPPFPLLGYIIRFERPNICNRSLIMLNDQSRIICTVITPWI